MHTQNDFQNLSREPVVVDAASRALYALATRVASTDCTVLINGESGTGKEVLARFIHDKSPRANRPFVAINCAAIPENMLEAMLFGYERGAFTGATSAHAGKFEQAQGGTLLLDEITEMPLSLQAKLLRVLQEREVERLGARTMFSLDVRVIATTNRDLRAEVKAGNFREDLFYRLCVFPMTISALRERRDDVLPLAMRLLEMRTTPGRRIPALSADAAQLLLSYAWPGNIRELDNLLQRAIIISNGPVIDAVHIRFEALRDAQPIRASAQVMDLDRELRGTLRMAEKQILLTALRSGTSRREVAERLGISPRTLRYKLAQLRSSGVDVPAA
ncbi:MAG: sigma-54-dependent Fis family transcriptional regulator [Proteobacteria bacterium]|jgi:two-component system, response regulator FlrC|nr:sigma-54-dependent Fis family transcriptional regulator [Pseudomonadota bacterium]MBK9251557.1 sigma-54-dependent Fis family transcriptional regulator [Pseudomonadota bacterium]